MTPPTVLTGALAVLLLVTAGCGDGGDGAASTGPSAGSGPSFDAAEWTTVWSDDFEGPAGGPIDTRAWLHSTGTGYGGGAANWGTGEIEVMTNSTDNVQLDGDGHLAITPIRDSVGRWTSARVETRRTDFQPPADGVLRVEASIQLPAVTGPQALGYWSAFWLLGGPARAVGATNWPGVGEIDILEATNGQGAVWGTMHCGVAPAGPCNEPEGLGSGRHPLPGVERGFHTYAIEWDRSVRPEAIRWYADGARYHVVTADRVDPRTWANATGHGFFVILNVAIGGQFPAKNGGGPAATTKSGVPMLVDRVTVYSR